MGELRRGDNCGNIYEIESRRFFRRWAFRLAILITAAGIGGGAWCGYQVIRKHHLEAQAERFYRSGDHRSAVLVARQLLNVDPGNLSATRLMAEMADANGRSEAVHWRQELLQRQATDENRLALVATALRCGQPALARRVFRGASAEASPRRYHELAGALALLDRNAEAAAAAFAQALRFEPDHAELRLNLASVRLASGHPDTVEEAREALRQLTTEKTVRTKALRALASEALARRSVYDGVSWAMQLAEQEDATMGDKLLLLDAARETADFEQIRQKVQESVITAPTDAAHFIVWLNRRGRAAEALAFGRTLAAAVVKAQPVRLALSESYSLLQQWQELERFVAEESWGEGDALRLAVLSHALRRQGMNGHSGMEAEAAWRSALGLAEKKPRQLVMLAQLTDGWGYSDEAEQAWWTVSENTHQSREALLALQKLYKRTADSHGLYRVAKRAYELNPRDLVAANNVASLGLLLGEANAARRLAWKLHSDHPQNVAFTTTYAFSLFHEGRYVDALNVMNKLPTGQLQHPAVAAYYVMMLVEAGDMERARKFLPVANLAELLPEERALLKSASQKVAEETGPELVLSATRS